MALKISFVCPSCGKKVMGLLSVWEYGEAEKEDNPILLKPTICQSGGLYGCYVECPACGENIDVFD